MLTLKGDISNITPQSPFDYLKWLGAVDSVHSGFLFYSPLGRLFKQKIVGLISDAITGHGFNFVEVQEYIPAGSAPEPDDFRQCSRLRTDAGVRWYCDPLVDALVVKDRWADVFWVKKYADTSLRVKSSSLRLHSYELITVLSTSDIARTLEDVLTGLFAMKIIVSSVSNDVQNCVITAKCGDKSFKLGHCHRPDCLRPLYIAGISVEKIISLMVRVNRSLETPIAIFDKYLINPTHLVNLDHYSNDYDICDSRNCKISEKVIRAKALGVNEVHILTNNKQTNEYEVKQIGF